MQNFLRFGTYIPISLLIACGGGGGGSGGENQLSNATIGAKSQYSTTANASLSNSKSASLSQILTAIVLPTIRETDDTTYLTVWTGSDAERNQLLFLSVAKLKGMRALPSDNSLQVPTGTTAVSYEFYDSTGTIIKQTVNL